MNSVENCRSRPSRGGVTQCRKFQYLSAVSILLFGTFGQTTVANSTPTVDLTVPIESSLEQASRKMSSEKVPAILSQPSSPESLATVRMRWSHQNSSAALLAQKPEPSPSIAQSAPETAQLSPVTPGTPEPPKVSPIQPSVTPATQSLTVEQYYYDWSDELGNRGSQYIAPITFTYQKGNVDLGIRTAYINSVFHGVFLLDGVKIGDRKGSVSTLSDTSVSLSYTLGQSRIPIRFNLDANVPTGQATLFGNQKNAIMDGALVQQTRFGEGWNFAPGISVSYPISPKDVLGLGVSHIMRGKFDPNGDVSNDVINPGNETVATLQYQHRDRNWLLIGGLIYTHYGTTRRDGQDYYRSGDRLDANATLVFSPFQGHRVQLSGRYFTQARNDVVNFFTGDFAKESANSNGRSILVSIGGLQPIVNSAELCIYWQIGCM
ncbi:hypothetical protein LEP3755_12830 [Leptolyngbya sp. NIES-3755]|nr:hypothetical protein LEP3755_12830 [Leptolyngbya sp. NIES-3755]